ncbi:glutamine amidotransferase [Marinobacter halodurans]|uniref:Glutamine amidotransferase n=1 Tax=Marinobacter halodurans TaxID=2528979 RepID=A0ABY1ZU95_9GAMM|nr:glutamine amidotransferase [Marinobacter halodurans]TBW59458.1 glutamine amidotransferase [Marinobacter halodurans]
MKTLSIIKTGTTYPEIQAAHGDFDNWFAEALKHQGLTLEVVDVTKEAPLPLQTDGILVTGSPAMVSDRAPWSDCTAAWLADQVASGRPVLGVCYGHQLLAHALGGRADYHPQGREIGTLSIQLSDEGRRDPLLGPLPPVFPAHLTHLQSAVELPPGAMLLARSGHEPHQAFRFGNQAWGVQFHPEFTAPIMHAYIDRLAPALADEGRSVGTIRDGIQETLQARAILHRFAERVAAG